MGGRGGWGGCDVVTTVVVVGGEESKHKVLMKNMYVAIYSVSPMLLCHYSV